MSELGRGGCSGGSCGLFIGVTVGCFVVGSAFPWPVVLGGGGCRAVEAGCGVVAIGVDVGGMCGCCASFGVGVIGGVGVGLGVVGVCLGGVSSGVGVVGMAGGGVVARCLAY